MSRRSHPHPDRGHGRPPRLELTHPSSPAPAPGPVDASRAPDRPVAFEAPVRPANVLTRPAAPDPDVAATVFRPGPAPVEPTSNAQSPTNLSTPTAPPPVAAMGAPAPDGDAGGRPGPVDGQMAGGIDPNRSAGCTSPQLRRFIKSRAYIPMHELRRRFAINGPDDDVAAIDIDGTRLYVGLPEREGRLLGELLRGGDVGAELSHDPVTPIIVGVYPMRPVPRS
jgi:hypothetical protein